MDKYTVDLDQVLNDFEYSELTDQQSKNASEKPQSSASFQPPPLIKHSINNVFHSLNEYLNSEISSNSNKGGLQQPNFGFEQQNLEKNDNNEPNNIKVKEPSEDVKSSDTTENQLVSYTFEFSGQSERLLKLKNEPQIGEDSGTAENNLNEVKDIDVHNTMQLNQQQEGVKDLNLLELTDENPSSINNVNLINSHQDILIENSPTEKSNGNLHKTDNQNFSLLDMENVEAEIIPGLNSIENIVKSEVHSVNNDKDCDKNIDNKADKVINEQTNFLAEESFVNVNECTLEGTEDNYINVSKINDNSKSLYEKTENEEEKASHVNVNIVEKFVIDPSISPYASGLDHLQMEKDSKKNGDANDPKLETVKELLIKSNDEMANNSSQGSRQMNENPNSPQKELPTYCNTKEDSLLTETITHEEDNSSINVQKSDNPEQNLVVESADLNVGHSEQKTVIGFSIDVDIDDSELKKMLEDLEIEEDSALDDVEKDLEKGQNFSNESQLEDVNRENVGENSLILEHTVGEGKDKVKQVDNIGIEPQSQNSQGETDSLHELSSRKRNDVVEDSEISLKKTKENIDSQLIECLEIEKPSKSKKTSSKNKEKSENIKKDYSEVTETIEEPSDDTNVAETPEQQSVEQELVMQDKEENSVSLQKQQSHDSLTRPQDLPLKEENVTTRKIDLIGSPGSTPYNNVYINKSIEPKTTQDTDSDYTSSASPTFSDCSTESTSTASTASVEDFPKNPGATKNPSHKNKHSEKTAGKHKESGRGGQEGDLRAADGESNIQEHSVDNFDHKQDVEAASSNTDQNVTDASKVAGGDSQESSSKPTETFLDKSWLGKEAPLWIPDSDAAACLHCDMKFTVLKRRHHCRACGLVLCSKCCNLKYRLEYLDAEARVCMKCYNILNKDSDNLAEPSQNTLESGDSPAFRPNPNNPLEYCSTVSPLQQIGQGGAPPPSVMVPVGVLKRKGSNKKSNKSVMFCDGIAPGSDLTHLDQDFNYHETKTPKSPLKVPEDVKKKEEPPPVAPVVRTSRNQPRVDQDTGCFIPKSETSLPPTVCINKTDILYSDCSNSPSVVEMLKNESLTYAINQNLFVHVKVINMSCCINKQAWCFSTDGLINVGSDEIVFLIEYIDEESFVPKDVFNHINNIYLDAVKGISIKEHGLSLHNTSNFLDSKNHAGFVYIRPTFQCLEKVLKPKEPYLIGILIHRWETPWAKLFPLRLILRLGAEYRYYPSPLISTRHRDSVFVEIGHTIINLLADFRNFTYTLPEIRGLIIHMEEKKTTLTIPRNRYDQVVKSINNSSDHILAFAGNFSSDADSHLVCIQDTQSHENCYTTHAINIHNQPRKITGASFIVFNGSLKTSSGLAAKSNIVEDGLMIQVPSEHLDKIRENLRNMKNHTIACGCINATSDETVNIVWGENDVDFNAGVQSAVDLTDMKGVPSIRVHNGKDYFCNNGTRLIRWSEVFILQNGEENPKNQDPVDVSKVSESIAKACCTALVKYLDLLVSNSCQKIGIRVTLHVENVSYSAGSNGLKLPPIYMRSLDNELVPVLHKITSNNLGDNAIVLELIFRILNA